VGLHIEDGATRSGVVNIGSFGVNGTDVIDDRTANAGEIIKQLLGVDSDDSFAVPVDDMKFGDGTDSDQQIVFNEGDAGNADPRLRFVNAQDLFQLTLDVMIGPDTGDATLTFDGGDTDSTLNWNEIDDIFEFDQPLQIGGAIPAISAPAGNDLEINVEDGQLVRLDTFTLEACSTVRAARTVTIDDCNVAALNGSVDIRALKSCDAATAHRVLHLICGAYTGVVTDGNNLKMAGDLDCGASSPATTLVLLCDGANWLELSRSVN
jgi:hypothetical protein